MGSGNYFRLIIIFHQDEQKYILEMRGVILGRGSVCENCLKAFPIKKNVNWTAEIY